MGPEKMRHSTVRHLVLTAAVVAALPATVGLAVITPVGGAPGDSVANPQAYVISTSGATALGALTRGATTNSNNNPTAEQNGLWRLGVDGYRIGRSTYNFGTSNPVQQYVSFRNVASPINGETTVRNNDHIVYQYSEVGSINGVLNTVKSGGLFIPNGLGNQVGPGVPSQSAPLWINGWKQINNTTFQVDGAGTTAGTAGGWAPYAGSSTTGQIANRIGYSDVRSFQAFAVDDIAGTASPDARPRDIASTAGNDSAQYGVGRSSYNVKTGARTTNFQALANRSVISGETANPNDSHLRNETLAVVPFATVANPGTGLVRFEEEQVRFLNGAGRLPNGANFNTVTREIGSGTRNQGANNFNIDASFAAGERDRRYMGTTPISTYVDSNGVTRNIVDVNGNPVTINPGDEIDPRLDLNGIDSGLAASEQPKEHRIGSKIRFSDKNSGGSGVRPVVVNNRMAIGANISVGDVGDRGIAGTSASGTDAMRVLKIRFNGQAGEAGANTDYTQPTAIDTTTGRYQQWSAAQAVSVIGVDSNGDGTFDALGTVGTDTDPNKPIFNDTIDYAGSKGLHRNWLNNITGSVATFGSAVTNVTPADAVIAAGFIPAQLMKNDKEFDGGIQSVRTLSTVDPDGAGPGLSEQALYDAVIVATGPGTLGARLNWADPAAINGNLGTTYTYKIFADDVGATVTTPTKTIVITNRTALAGDLNNDTVRDLADVTDLAKAYAASEVVGAIAGGASLDSTNITFGSQTLTAADMVVLTDFNGNGNISGTNASPVFRAVDRADVMYFLKGATIDTSSYTNADGVVITSPTAQQRREDGIRFGTLKKNAAIDTFNTAFLAAGGSASLTMKKSDVDGDGDIDLLDAKHVDGLVGVAPYSLTLAELLTQYDIDPIYAELTDDNLINAAGDFAVLKTEIGSLLKSGDTDFNGLVNFNDLLALAKNYSTNVDRWSKGDFDLNGSVTFNDLLALARNYGSGALVDGGLSDGFAADWALAQSLVPEPTSLGVLTVTAVATLRRRRRA